MPMDIATSTNSMISVPTVISEGEERYWDEIELDVDDLESIDSMFDPYPFFPTTMSPAMETMSLPEFKSGQVSTGRNLPSGWEMRYDTVLCQFYYVNAERELVQFDSPLEVSQH